MGCPYLRSVKGYYYCSVTGAWLDVHKQFVREFCLAKRRFIKCDLYKQRWQEEKMWEQLRSIAREKWFNEYFLPLLRKFAKQQHTRFYRYNITTLVKKSLPKEHNNGDIDPRLLGHVSFLSGYAARKLRRIKGCSLGRNSRNYVVRIDKHAFLEELETAPVEVMSNV